MKVEDIQIGDWVQNPLGVPYQVWAIHFYKINGDGDGYYAIHLKNKGAVARLEIYDLHPVPLMSEILEKNGFEKDPESGEMIWTDGIVTEVVWVGTILTIRGEHANAEFVTCMYIHELQHALRLCGIEKEIEI